MDEIFLNSINKLKLDFLDLINSKEGKRRVIKGNVCEVFINNSIISWCVKNTLFQIKPKVKIKWSKNNFKLSGTKEIDLGLFINDELKIAIEIKDYADSPQFDSLLIAHQLLQTKYPDIKSILISMHLGSPSQIRDEKINVLKIKNIYHLNLIPSVRNSKNQYYLSDISNIQMFEYVSNCRDLFFEILN